MEKNEEEENNLDDIDDEEDKIVTNIIPKIYGLSTKGKQQNDLDEKKSKTKKNKYFI